MRIALQMDPIEAVNIDGDSTFLLGLGAQARGHQLFYYQPKDLRWETDASGKGVLAASMQSAQLRREKGNHVTLGAPERVILQDAVDVILLRQDPPFHMGYLTTTYLLEQVSHKVRVLNDPKGVRDSPEKMLITQFAEFLPPTLISSDAGDLTAFANHHGTVVAKKIYGHGGRDVFKFGKNDPALLTLAAMHLKETGEPIMLQVFLPKVSEGDKRIILFNGEVVGAVQRVPARGQFLANLAQGGTAQTCELTVREKEICAAIGPELKKRGLYFTGLDTIDDHLIEINVTSPTALAAVNRLYALEGDARMEARFWEGIEG